MEMCLYSFYSRSLGPPRPARPALLIKYLRALPFIAGYRKRHRKRSHVDNTAGLWVMPGVRSWKTISTNSSCLFSGTPHQHQPHHHHYYPFSDLIHQRVVPRGWVGVVYSETSAKHAFPPAKDSLLLSLFTLLSDRPPTQWCSTAAVSLLLLCSTFKHRKHPVSGCRLCIYWLEKC